MDKVYDNEVVFGNHLYKADYENGLWRSETALTKEIHFNSFHTGGGKPYMYYSPYHGIKILDPLYFDSKYKVSIDPILMKEAFAYKNDLLEKINRKAKENKYYAVDAAFRQRYYKMRLPRIKFGNDTWVVDGYTRMFFNEAKPDISIHADRLNLSQDDRCHLMIYDPKTFEDQTPNLHIMTSFSPDLLILEIPNIDILDPIGKARRHDLDRFYYLFDSMLKMELKAEIVPYKGSYAEEWIEENKKKSDLKKDYQKETIKRCKRGKGLK